MLFTCFGSAPKKYQNIFKIRNKKKMQGSRKTTCKIVRVFWGAKFREVKSVRGLPCAGGGGGV
jgi:hypothetical protein